MTTARIVTLHTTKEHTVLTEQSRHYGILFMKTFYNVVNSLFTGPLFSQSPSSRGQFPTGFWIESCRTLCPTLVTCWFFHFHICFTQLKIYHLSFFHNTVRHWHCWSWQYAGSNMNLVYGLTLNKFSTAQVDKAPAQWLGGHWFESCPGLRFFPCYFHSSNF